MAGRTPGGPRGGQGHRRPRARGRFGKILKPFSQVTIKVRQVSEETA